MLGLTCDFEAVSPLALLLLTVHTPPVRAPHPRCQRAADARPLAPCAIAAPRGLAAPLPRGAACAAPVLPGGQVTQEGVGVEWAGGLGECLSHGELRAAQFHLLWAGIVLEP